MEPNEDIKSGIANLVDLLKLIKTKNENLLAATIWLLLEAELYEESDKLLHEILEPYTAANVPTYLEEWISDQKERHYRKELRSRKLQNQ